MQTITLAQAARAIVKDRDTEQNRTAWAAFVGEVRAEHGYIPGWIKRRSFEVELAIVNGAA